MIGVAAGWGGAVPLWGGEVAKSFKGINQGAPTGCSSCPELSRQ